MKPNGNAMFAIILMLSFFPLFAIISFVFKYLNMTNTSKRSFKLRISVDLETENVPIAKHLVLIILKKIFLVIFILILGHYIVPQSEVFTIIKKALEFLQSRSP
jgi:hypothetical protein